MDPNQSKKPNQEKRPFILVEGPDGGGKTTLVTRLRKELGWDAKFLNHRTGKQFPRYASEYGSQHHVIFERGHVSEEVYSTIWRGGNPFSHAEKKILDEWVSRQGLVILAIPEIELLRARYAARGNQKIRWQEVERAHWLFNKAFENISCIRYASTDVDELEKVISQVKEQVESHDLDRQ